MSEQKKVNREEDMVRRSICELIMGALMLILVAGINLRADEHFLLFSSGSDAGGSLSYSSFAASNGAENADEANDGWGSIEAAVSDGSENGENRSGENQEEGPSAKENGQYCVVLDAGHGAADPGKIGCNDAKEKDINLAIVQKLKKNLEEEDVRVVLTRESDAPLYDSSAANKKISDMNARVSIIESILPDLVVSIHQNSYHESSVCGPQVFYYKTSEEGKKAAECLQASFDGLEEIENRRMAKANDNYYLLLHTSVPMVIAECGFLSNPQEAQLLIQDSYQEKVAWVLHLGIMQYLNDKGGE